MHKQIFKILSLMLAICSNGVFAEIKEKLIELSKATEPYVINKVIKDIVATENLSSITVGTIDPQYIEDIFTAMTKGDANNDSVLLFLKLLDQSYIAPRKSVDLIASYVRNIDNLSDGVKKAFNDGKNFFKFLYSFTQLLGKPVDDSLIKDLETVLSWQDFATYRGPLLLALFAPLISSETSIVDNHKQLQLNFLSFVINKDSDWLKHALFVLEIMNLVQKMAFPELWPKFEAIILGQLREDLKAGLKFHEELSKLLDYQINENGRSFQKNLLDEIGVYLQQPGIADPKRDSVFKNIINTVVHIPLNDETQELKNGLLAFLIYNLRPQVNDLKKYKNKILPLPKKMNPQLTAQLAKEILASELLKFDYPIDYDTKDFIQNNILMPIVSSYINEASTDEKIETLDMLLPFLYKSDFDSFRNRLFSELPKEDAQKAQVLPTARPSKVICNQEGYDEGIYIECIQGKPVKLDAETPIGYNVHLPQGEVKAIFTHVYGGYNVDTKQNMYRPNELDVFEEYLLAHGIAIVQLNLLDLREMHGLQQKMPADLHRRMHESINQYFEAFKRPQDLHPDLAILENKPNFLFGSSFGGRTSIRHAELFPKTFKGYISQDGSLDFATNDKIDGGNRSKHEAQKWLDPINEVGSLRDSVLLLHNLDDNKVNAAVSLSFYKKALERGLGDKVRLLLTIRGNPIEGQEEHYKGHYMPEDAESLQRIGAYVVRFMTEGPSVLPAASELAAHVHQYSAVRKTSGRYLEEDRVMAALYRHYNKTKPAEITDQLWQDEYVPILQSLLLSGFHDFSVIKSALKNLSNQIDEQAISNVVAYHADLFAEYLVEKYGWNINPSMVTDLINKNKAIHDFVKREIMYAIGPRTLEHIKLSELTFQDVWQAFSLAFSNVKVASPAPDSVDRNRGILSDLIMANPTLSENLIKEIYPSNAPKASTIIFDDFKNDFKQSLKDGKRIANMTWQQAVSAVKAVLQEKREGFLNFKKLAVELEAPKPLDDAQILSLFKDLLKLADPYLGDLAKVSSIRASLRKLSAIYDQCAAVECKVYRAAASLSLALLVRHEKFMEETILKAAADLKGHYSQEKKLGDVIISTYLQPLMEALSPENRWLSPALLDRFKTLLP